MFKLSPRGFSGRRFGRPGVVVMVAVVLAAFAFFLPAAAPATYAQQPSPTFDLTQVNPPASRSLALRGQPLFSENCSPCHGITGNGDGPTAPQLPDPPSIFADPATAWEITPAEWFYAAKFGRLEKLMPPWQNSMTDAQIWDTIYFAWQLHTNELNLVNGQVLYDEQCAACHGSGGAGDGPEAEADLLNLADPTYAMSVSQADWMAGWQTAHPEEGGAWSEQQQRNVLEYIRSFNYAPIWEPPFRAGNAVFQGNVIQGSAHGADVAGIEIELDAFMGFEPIANFTSTVAADGTFVFEGLDPNPEIIYMASAYYGTIGYSSQPLNFTPDTNVLDTSMTVFETTDDPTGLTLARMHWIVDSQPGFLIVGQIATYGMDGDRTFIGAAVAGMTEPGTVAMYVPAAAEEISFQNGELGGRFQQVGNLIYDTSPIAPGAGTRQIIVRYVIPYNDTQAMIDQELLYPTQDFTLLVAELPGLEGNVTGLEFGGVQSLSDQSYLLWQGLELAPQKITATLTGLLAPGAIDPRSVQSASGGSSAGAAGGSDVAQPLEMWVILLSGAVVVLALVAGLIWSRRRGQVDGRVSIPDLRQERNNLVAQIARLDDQHALGELDGLAWERQRSQLKAQLIQIAAKLTKQQAGNPESRE